METHGGNGSPGLVRPCRRGKAHRQGDSAYHASATASGQAWTRASHGRRPTARSGTVVCNIRRKFCSLHWHFAHDPPWWKSWRKSLSRWTDARLQVVQQICMQEGGQTERAAFTGVGLGASTTATADGARLAHRWISRWRRGRTRRWTRMGWQSSTSLFPRSLMISLERPQMRVN